MVINKSMHNPSPLDFGWIFTLTGVYLFNVTIGEFATLLGSSIPLLLAFGQGIVWVAGWRQKRERHKKTMEVLDKYIKEKNGISDDVVKSIIDQDE